MLKITLATGNKHKVDEINLIAKNYDVEFILPNGEFNPVEDGSNFLENAYAKAKYASKNGLSELYLADDSGLCIDYLNGEPGIKSARYESTPQKRIDKVLEKLKGIKDRKAHFTCAMVVVDKKGEILFQTQQYVKGSILEKQIGQNGFGYDPIFYVEEKNCSMAELKDSEKAQISHRSKALNEVLKWINSKTK